MKGLSGKVAFVAGGSKGIGKACSLAFSKQGTKVAVIGARDLEAGEETVREIKEAGGEAIFIQADISQGSQVEKAVDKTVKAFGCLDFGVNVAGVGHDLVPVDQIKEEVYDQVMDVNMKGIWWCMKYQIPQMLKTGKGAIVNISSGIGLVGSGVKLSIYAASKHGVIGITRSAALEYAQKGIRINAVCPGTVMTPLVKTYPKEWIDGLIALHPIGRLAEAEEIADGVLWLCSDSSSFVIGHALCVDGGYTAQ